MKRRVVFNSRKWNGRDVGDNSQFFEEAEILREYYLNQELVADVKWDDGTVTTGHFVSGMRAVESMRRLPVTLNSDRHRLVGYLSIEPEIPDELLKEMVVSWLYSVSSKTVLEMTLVPKAIMPADKLRTYRPYN